MLLLTRGACEWTVTWSADGKSILCRVSRQSYFGIPDVNEAGKAEVVLEGEANTNLWFLIQSPDRAMESWGAEVPGDNNAWMVENF
jgi:hypothetical protein